MNYLNQTKSPTFFWLLPSHSTWLFREHSGGNSTSFLINPWNFHILQYTWKIHASATHIRCLAWIFPGIAHCFQYVFISYWVAILRKWPVLFSLFRAGLSTFKTAKYWEVTFLLQFSRQKIPEKSTKNKGFQRAVTQGVLV